MWWCGCSGHDIFELDYTSRVYFLLMMLIKKERIYPFSHSIYMEKNHLVKQNSLPSFQWIILCHDYCYNLSKFAQKVQFNYCFNSIIFLLKYFILNNMNNLLMLLQENYDTNYLFWWDVVLVRCMCQVSSIMHDEKEHMGVWAKKMIIWRE